MENDNIHVNGKIKFLSDTKETNVLNKIGIVILNYLNYTDTIECIESLETQTNQNFEVVIVDNASHNESFSVLDKLYKNKKRIHMIRTDKNLGYAKGNNVGIQYCKNELQINNILIVNSDVIFTESNYTDYFINLKTPSNIGAIGTKIIGSDGLNQNPVYTPITSKRVLKDAAYFSLDDIGIIKYYTTLKKLVTKKQDNSKFEEKTFPVHGKKYILHGSAIFLTEHYLKRMDGFYPETFLYYEENILGIIMEKMNLLMLYTDETEIYHKEDQSSALSFGNNSSKMFKRYLAQSIRIAVKVKLSNINQIQQTVNRK